MRQPRQLQGLYFVREHLPLTLSCACKVFELLLLLGVALVVI